MFKLEHTYAVIGKWIKVVIVGSGTVFTAWLATRVWKSVEPLGLPKTPSNCINKVLFFPDKTVPCHRYLLTPQGCNFKRCKYSHDLSTPFCQLIKTILDATKCLDICIFSFTDVKLFSAVLLKHKQGVKVRIITDTEYMKLSGSQVFELIKAGIEVRHNSNGNLMHHKFAIVDSKLILTGSFNWTQAAASSNNENIAITDNKEIVSQYVGEFSRLWDKFDAQNRHA